MTDEKIQFIYIFSLKEEEQRQSDKQIGSLSLNCYSGQMKAELTKMKSLVTYCRRTRNDYLIRMSGHNIKLDFYYGYYFNSMRWSIDVFSREAICLFGIGKYQLKNTAVQTTIILVVILPHVLWKMVTRFNFTETIGDVFHQDIDGVIQLSVRDRIWRVRKVLLRIMAEESFQIENENLRYTVCKWDKKNDFLIKIDRLELRRVA